MGECHVWVHMGVAVRVFYCFGLALVVPGGRPLLVVVVVAVAVVAVAVAAVGSS